MTVASPRRAKGTASAVPSFLWRRFSAAWLVRGVDVPKLADKRLSNFGSVTRTIATYRKWAPFYIARYRGRQSDGGWGYDGQRRCRKVAAAASPAHLPDQAHFAR